jgi:deoxyribonuclease-4
LKLSQQNNIAKIIRHSSLERLPFILETPNELDGHAKEIKTLKERVLHYI